MTSRYDSISVGINSSGKYEKIFKDRNVNFIRQYFTPMMEHMTAEDIATLNIVSHLWQLGDRYYKLAHTYYGDSSLWWLIAWFNRSPTESHLKIGDVIEIPLPLEKVLAVLDL